MTKTPIKEQMEVNTNDIYEIPVFSKRKVFFEIFFQVHNNQPEDNVISIVGSYRKAEVLFVKKFGAKGYASEESFLRTYYYYMNTKIKTSTV